MMPRRLLAILALTSPLLLATLVAATLQASADPNPASPALADVFSEDGVLTATLAAQQGKVHIDTLELDATTYNGIYSGPVLHVHPGDLMRLKLVNRLSQPTNLHFHGIRTSPLGNSDNPHIVIQPDATLTYEVRIPPTQPTGLFWYHAHLHGSAERQIMGGLSGSIIVEGPASANMTTRLFVLKDMIFNEETGNTEIDGTLHGIVQSANGRLTTTETMQPNETQLWRFTNQSANRALHLSLNGHRFRIVAEDGETIAAERPVDVLDIPPSSRLEVLVDAGPAGNYELLAKGLMTGTGAARTYDRVIGQLTVAGEPAAAAAALIRPPPSADLRNVRISEKRTVAFSQTTAADPADQQFFINGKIFDPDRMDVRVPLGTTEEWTVRNDSDDLHVFHIHQIGFQVTEVNGKPVPFTGYVDTIRVPERGEVKLRMPFTDPLIIGRFMFHCHVLKHEDQGMMANIEVYDPDPPSLPVRLSRLYLHVLWWWHGVPWSKCGFGEA